MHHISLQRNEALKTAIRGLAGIKKYYKLQINSRYDVFPIYFADINDVFPELLRNPFIISWSAAAAAVLACAIDLFSCRWRRIVVNCHKYDWKSLIPHQEWRFQCSADILHLLITINCQVT